MSDAALPHRLAAAGLALAACGHGSCTDGAATGPAEAIDLLVRRADRVFEQVGELVPSEGTEWGAYGGPGWTKEVGTFRDGTFLDTNQPRASLRLPASTPTGRVLAITLWCRTPVPDGPGTAIVRLNGRELELVTLASAPETVSLDTPAELWRLGDNKLEFETPLVTDSGPPRWDTLSVARVVYGPARRVVNQPRGRVVLPSETGLRYLVEAAPPARLALDAQSAAAGTLTIRCGALDARTGELDFTGFRDLSLSISKSHNETLPLPHRAGSVQVIELIWSSPTDTPLTLRRLQVLEETPRPRPPIVFVSIDTYSARHMSVYGYGRKTTPNLERLAEESVVFERCVANAPWTMPSYLSVMTGLYPGAHLAALQAGPGLELDNYDYWQVAESRWTLAEALRARGYQTAASVDTLWLSPRFRIHQGFDLYDLEPAQYPFDQPYYGIAFILDRLVPWLDDTRDPAAPFFLFLHALDAHGPYWPEAPFLDAFRDDLPEDRRDTPAGAAHQAYRAIPTWMARTLVPDGDVPIPPELPLAEIVARYDETILKTDDYIGRLCDLLRERGLYDEAVIVVTGDHGESFDHDLYSHGNLWEDVVHVPLVVKLPRGEHGGTRVRQSVQLVDLYPTLCELAGADATREYLHGRSLLPLMRGDAADPRPTFSAGGHIEQAMIEEGGWKLVELRPGVSAAQPPVLTHARVPAEWRAKNFPALDDGILTDELWEELQAQPDFQTKFEELRALTLGPYYELYDLSTDPDERHDLSEERPKIVAHLKALLQAEQQRTLAARADANPEIVPADFSEEELRRLRELGYGR